MGKVNDLTFALTHGKLVCVYCKNICWRIFMYQIDDHVAYPLHGVGIIQNIEIKEILGKKRNYYILFFPKTNAKVMVPLDMPDELGLRKIVGEKALSRAISILESEEYEVEEEWRLRYSNNYAKMKRAGFDDLLSIVKNLFIRNHIKELSSSEKKLFHEALAWILDEISLSCNMELREVEDQITEVLSSMLEKVQAHGIDGVKKA